MKTKAKSRFSGRMPDGLFSWRFGVIDKLVTTAVFLEPTGIDPFLRPLRNGASRHFQFFCELLVVGDALLDALSEQLQSLRLPTRHADLASHVVSDQMKFVSRNLILGVTARLGETR